MARPNANPRSTGLAMKSDMLPTRSNPAAANMRPPISTMPAPSSSRNTLSPPAADSDAAASTAAEDDVADTIAKRLPPNKP